MEKGRRAKADGGPRMITVDRLADSQDEVQRLRAIARPASPANGVNSSHRGISSNTNVNSDFTIPPLPANTLPRSPSPSHSGSTRPPATERTSGGGGLTGNNGSALDGNSNSGGIQRRFGSFLSSTRRSNPSQSTGSTTATVIGNGTGSGVGTSTGAGTTLSSPPPIYPLPTNTTDLKAALTREQALRQQAEGQLSQANGELEELSAQLFQQANEMVATERKARAKLEERVEMLERRDREKRKRLERLEGAVVRIERVRNLLAES